MEEFKRFYFPNMCISYTLTLVILAILGGGKGGLPMSYILEFFGALVVITVSACFFNGVVRFRHRFMYPLMELTVNYVVIFGAAYLFRWCSLKWNNIILIAVIVAALYGNIYFRSQREIKNIADHINAKLKQQ